MFRGNILFDNLLDRRMLFFEQEISRPKYIILWSSDQRLIIKHEWWHHNNRSSYEDGLDNNYLKHCNSIIKTVNINSHLTKWKSKIMLKQFYRFLSRKFQFLLYFLNSTFEIKKISKCSWQKSLGPFPDLKDWGVKMILFIQTYPWVDQCKQIFWFLYVFFVLWIYLRILKIIEKWNTTVTCGIRYQEKYF